VFSRIGHWSYHVLRIAHNGNAVKAMVSSILIEGVGLDMISLVSTQASITFSHPFYPLILLPPYPIPHKGRFFKIGVEVRQGRQVDQ
jgi:hypothetical protein